MNFLLENKGFVLGLLIALIVLALPTPEGLSSEAHRTAAIFLLMGTWWATEAVPVAVTALVPLALFPLLGIVDIQNAANPYANKIVYLFLGGFLIATAIQKWNLHKRIALFVLNNAGSNGASLILGFMVTAAVISMWVMNTATTIMLLPIGLAVITVVKETVKGLSEKETENFQLALLLGIAYGATIGGMSTLIGTGPNGMLAAFMADNYGLDISFVDWMKVGVPLSAVMLPCSWLILTRIIFKVKFETSTETIALLSDMKEELGSLRGPEYKVLLVFILTAAAWMFRTLIDNVSFLEGLSDAGIAMIERAKKLGVKNICIHKGLPFGPRSYEHSQSSDIGVVAKMFPEMNFLIYHSSYVSTNEEVEFVAGAGRDGIDTLIQSLVDNDVSPNSNVYAELGSTWRLLMQKPDDAAHALGKLLKYCGEDNVL